MSGIEKTLKYKETIAESFQEIFSTLFFLSIEKYDSIESKFSCEKDISVAMNFLDDHGYAMMHISQQTSQALTSDILAVPTEELSQNDINDNIKEIFNMICGNIKNRIDETDRFQLTIPRIVQGRTVVSEECLKFTFYSDNFSIIFKICIH